MTTLDEKIKVMQAFKDGKPIEIYSNNSQRWVDWTIDSEPDFNWELYNYRIKEEPKKKVKLYKALIRETYTNSYMTSSRYYPTLDKAQRDLAQIDLQVIRLLPHTMIEVEED